jgi:hypothetical protein
MVCWYCFLHLDHLDGSPHEAEKTRVQQSIAGSYTVLLGMLANSVRDSSTLTARTIHINRLESEHSQVPSVASLKIVGIVTYQCRLHFTVHRTKLLGQERLLQERRTLGEGRLR